MARTNLEFIAIISLLLPLTLNFHVAFPNVVDIDEAEGEYVLDKYNTPLPHLRRVLSRFSHSSIYKIRKGTHCDPASYNICNGISANNGTSMLYCCKAHCRNVLGDRNNCGVCGHKCSFGERCCNGTCTKVLFNVHHCGKCERKCSSGVSCDNGFCGYA